MMNPTRKLRIGLHGVNGHQILGRLENHPRAEAVALSSFPAEKIPPWAARIPVRRDLEELLTDPTVDLISLCSPRREVQCAEAIRCLRAGKHVLAEKPCAMTEGDLDILLQEAAASGRLFHEMGGSAFEQPWLEIGYLARSGVIGSIRQVFAQKSYPMYRGRSLDPAVDGGLFLQVGIHAARWIEHGLGLRIQSLKTETQHSADQHPVAISAALRLEGEATGVIILNYLNPEKFPSWGNETLRVWGDDGLVEAVDGGSRTRLVTSKGDLGEIPLTQSPTNWFEAMLDEILHDKPMPLTLEEEVHPLRGLLRASFS
jgi:predicted dehydrogenase